MKLFKALYLYILGSGLLWFCLAVLINSSLPSTLTLFELTIPLRELLKGLAELAQSLFLIALVAPVAQEILSGIAVKLAEQYAPAVTAITNEIKGALVTGFKDVTESIKASIERDGVNLFPPGSINVDEELNKKLKQSISNYEQTLSAEISQTISKAFDSITQGRYHEGLRKLKDLADNKSDPAIYKVLMGAYGMVLDSRNAKKLPELLQEARKLLDTYGDPIHFLTIAYNYWESGDISGAIQIAEKGLTRFEHSNEDELAVMGLRNSLAYYYADSGDPSKKDRSLHLINEALSYWESVLLSEGGRAADIERRYANSLDTLGYTKITFGDTMEDWREGEALCKKANDMGLEATLYAKHFSKFSEKMKSSMAAK